MTYNIHYDGPHSPATTPTSTTFLEVVRAARFATRSLHENQDERYILLWSVIHVITLLTAATTVPQTVNLFLTNLFYSSHMSAPLTGC